MGLLAGAAGLTAHEKFKIVGTVVKIQAEQIDVKAVDGATYEIDMNEKTAFIRDAKKVPASEVRPGQHVTVLALGHDAFDLEAYEVQLLRRLPSLVE
jgi:hypothetical protein